MTLVLVAEAVPTLTMVSASAIPFQSGEAWVNVLSDDVIIPGVGPILGGLSAVQGLRLHLAWIAHEIGGTVSNASAPCGGDTYTLSGQPPRFRSTDYFLPELQTTLSIVRNVSAPFTMTTAHRWEVSPSSPAPPSSSPLVSALDLLRLNTTTSATVARSTARRVVVPVANWTTVFPSVSGDATSPWIQISLVNVSFHHAVSLQGEALAAGDDDDGVGLLDDGVSVVLGCPSTATVWRDDISPCLPVDPSWDWPAPLSTGQGEGATDPSSSPSSSNWTSMTAACVSRQMQRQLCRAASVRSRIRAWHDRRVLSCRADITTLALLDLTSVASSFALVANDDDALLGWLVFEWMGAIGVVLKAAEANTTTTTTAPAATAAAAASPSLNASMAEELSRLFLASLLTLLDLQLVSTPSLSLNKVDSGTTMAAHDVVLRNLTSFTLAAVNEMLTSQPVGPIGEGMNDARARYPATFKAPDVARCWTRSTAEAWSGLSATRFAIGCGGPPPPRSSVASAPAIATGPSAAVALDASSATLVATFTTEVIVSWNDAMLFNLRNGSALGVNTSRAADSLITRTVAVPIACTWPGGDRLLLSQGQLPASPCAGSVALVVPDGGTVGSSRLVVMNWRLQLAPRITSVSDPSLSKSRTLREAVAIASGGGGILWVDCNASLHGPDDGGGKGGRSAATTPTLVRRLSTTDGIFAMSSKEFVDLTADNSILTTASSYIPSLAEWHRAIYGSDSVEQNGEIDGIEEGSPGGDDHDDRTWARLSALCNVAFQTDADVPTSMEGTAFGDSGTPTLCSLIAQGRPPTDVFAGREAFTPSRQLPSLNAAFVGRLSFGANRNCNDSTASSVRAGTVARSQRSPSSRASSYNAPSIVALEVDIAEDDVFEAFDVSFDVDFVLLE